LKELYHFTYEGQWSTDVQVAMFLTKAYWEHEW